MGSSFFQNRPEEKLAMAVLLAGIGLVGTYYSDFKSSQEYMSVSQNSIANRSSSSDVTKDCSVVSSTNDRAASVATIKGAIHLDDNYDVDWKQCIGRGTYGTAHAGLCKHTLERVVLKRICRKETNAAEFLSEWNVLVRILEKGGHPNINRLRDVFADENHFYLVLDFAAGGELFDHLIEYGMYYEADAALVMEQIASALKFLHNTAGVVHLDLKPENVLLSTPNRSNASIQVIDFGEATVDANDDEPLRPMLTKELIEMGQTLSNTKRRKNSGTTAYWSPERFHQSEAADASLPYHYDMWSVGVILYILLTGVHPFDISGSASDEEVRRRIRKDATKPLSNQSLVGHLSEDAIDLMRKLMELDPNKRLTASEMLHHPWIVKHRTRQRNNSTAQAISSNVTTTALKSA
jgi:serine/threonine protein kinase